MRNVRITLAIFLLALPLGAATFGTVFSPPGGISYSDIVLDEGRTLLYLVNSNANRIDMFNTRTRTFGASIPTDIQPVSAALSRDRRFLYVTTYTTSVAPCQSGRYRRWSRRAAADHCGQRKWR